MSRRELYGPNDLPVAIKVIVAFCDTQDDRLECQFVGFGTSDECWAIEYAIIPRDPAQGVAWRELGTLLARSFTRRDGQILRCGAAGVDAVAEFLESADDFELRRPSWLDGFRLRPPPSRSAYFRLLWTRR